jgi:cell wall-associated NlpC family hydrolase
MRKLAAVLLVGPLLAATPLKKFSHPAQMVVKDAVVDVRAEPRPHKGDYEYDPLQETQLSQGDPVIVYGRAGEWARIEAPEQVEYTHSDRWEGYPGWVKWKSLTKDLSRYHAIKKLTAPEDELRSALLKNAERHLGTRYLWGGRSLHDPKIKGTATGVDCSGLVNWSFRETGRFVPRDAHEQFMRARPVDPKKLKPGDLIFLAKTEKPEKIVHVAFYFGDEKLIEAPQTGEPVRIISFAERFGRSRADLGQKMTVGDRVLYFGTLIEEAQ